MGFEPVTLGLDNHCAMAYHITPIATYHMVLVLYEQQHPHSLTGLLYGICEHSLTLNTMITNTLQVKVQILHTAT